MTSKMQSDTDAETRTRVLTSLARILAPSMVRGHLQHPDHGGHSHEQVDTSERDTNEPNANEEIGDEG